MVFKAMPTVLQECQWLEDGEECELLQQFCAIQRSPLPKRTLERSHWIKFHLLCATKLDKGIRHAKGSFTLGLLSSCSIWTSSGLWSLQRELANLDITWVSYTARVMKCFSQCNSDEHGDIAVKRSPGVTFINHGREENGPWNRTQINSLM